MKQIKLIVPLLITVLAISCDNMGSGKKDEGRASEKYFSNPAEAAGVAKNDMLQAMKDVNFGVERKKLEAASPGQPVMKYDLSWESLLKADSTSGLEQMATAKAATLVPLVNGNEVVAIISLRDNNSQYSISGIGDAQVTRELDLVKKVISGDQQGEISGIYEVPNLNAFIYAVNQNGRQIYYTAYNNNSLRQGMTISALIPQLKADAQQFEKQYGSELRKNKLVK
jgi:hypothetical protein